MNTDAIRELGKKEIGWDRHKTLTGEGSANSVLFHWMVGFEKAMEIFNSEFKEISEIGDYPFEVIGFSREWIDQDFNPNGTRLCFKDDASVSGWTSLGWNNHQDCWSEHEDHAPTHFKFIRSIESLNL